MLNLEIHKNIIEKCKQGDARAQFELFKLYNRAMYNTCYRMMNHHEDAQDMLQDSFSDAFRKLNTFAYNCTFGAWLKRIVVNHCINELKRKKPELKYCEELPAHREDEDASVGLSVEMVKSAMMQLPEGSRVIFSLYLLEGYDHGEIAQILGVTESNSKSQYMRAKRRVYEILKEKVYEE